jgi:glycosyltransferase involved in cell wall biosynthesis
MTAAPLVSFVVPCYNYGHYLADCLQSIFGQQGDYADFEIIAIDDCSTDNTREVLSSFPDPRLRIVYHDVNRGHVYTVNEGFALARGDFVARIDPDDRYRPNFLAALFPRFKDRPTVGMVYGDAALIDANGTITLATCDTVHGGRDYCGNELLALLECNYICAPTAIARREAWQVGLPIWEGMAFNDWYLNVMIARDYDLCYVNEVVADYRIHSQNHHSRIVYNKSEEPSILRVLDHVYGLPERTAELQAQKMRHRNRIYAAQYLTLAEKYFGVGFFDDARRCYQQVWRRNPREMMRPGPCRHWLATFLGRNRYEAWKSLYRRLRTGTKRSTGPLESVEAR